MESVQIPVFLLFSSLVAAAVGQHHDHPSPKVLKEPKEAIPPDRKEAQLDQDIENTNDARGDHGCGPSGAQATADEAVIKTNGGRRNANPSDYPCSPSNYLSLISSPSSLPMPLVPRTVTCSNSQQNA